MPLRDAAFHYPDGGDAPLSLEPDWWWAALPLADAAVDGCMASGALPAGQDEVLWHATWAPPDGFATDDIEPCSW